MTLHCHVIAPDPVPTIAELGRNEFSESPVDLVPLAPSQGTSLDAF